MSISKLIKKYEDGEVLCLVDLAIRVIGGKWKPIILWHLGKEEILRYGELKKRLGSITPKMLTQQLRELESFGMVIRRQYNQIPPKVEYTLSERGHSAMPLLEQMCKWSANHILTPASMSAAAPIKATK